MFVHIPNKFVGQYFFLFEELKYIHKLEFLIGNKIIIAYYLM